MHTQAWQVFSLVAEMDWRTTGDRAVAEEIFKVGLQRTDGNADLSIAYANWLLEVQFSTNSSTPFPTNRFGN